jgi:hypothetical protein
LNQGLKLIDADVRSIPIMPILIIVTVVFAALCVGLFWRREKKKGDKSALL